MTEQPAKSQALAWVIWAALMVVIASFFFGCSAAPGMTREAASAQMFQATKGPARLTCYGVTGVPVFSGSSRGPIWKTASGMVFSLNDAETLDRTVVYCQGGWKLLDDGEAP